MSSASYKFTFRLNAYHSNVDIHSGVHSHTFEIVLFMSPIREDFVAYESIEGIVKEYLNVFSGKTFNLIAPFDHTPPTLENIGEVFYSDLSEVLLKNGYQLKKLGISENPQRVFNISGHNITEAENLRIKEAVVNLRNDPKTTGYASLPTTQSMPEKVEPPTFREELTDSQTENALPKSANYSKEILVMQVIILIAAGAAAMIYVRISNMYPLGMDIHGHLFKADLMYHRLREGDLYPLYTELWYNGIQPFRYWPPLPYYLLAIFQFIFSGNVMNAYLLFIWTSFSVGAIGWLMFARKLARPWLGFFFALTWFLFPDNLRVFFGEGNLPRMFIAMIAPYLFYCLWQYVFYQKKKMAIPLLILMTVAIMGHLMIAAMIGVASTIFLLLYVILNKRWIESVQAILVMFFSFALCGIWVYPSLLGGITAMSSEATSSMVALVSEKLSTSLNPFYRLEDGIATLYFGLSIVLIALVGLLFSNRRSMPGFITFLIFVLGTASAFAPLIVNIPLSQYLWVRRFIPIVYVLFVIALLEWKSLKKPVLVVMCCLIMLDILPSLALNKFNQRMNIPATNDVISQTMDAYLFSKAKSITKQRISLMDLSMFGPMPSYGFCSVDPQTQYVFGWAWQASVTAMNIAYLNESLEMKNYSYMFDRNLELGADVVLVDKRQVKSSVDRREMFSAAEIVGYSLIEESDYSLLFSYPVDSTFGVITQYECLAIGTTAALVPGILPYYHPGDKLFIDDYSVGELIKYKKIYLSGFFYNNRENAENLVREIADAGVEVFIDMSRIPADPLTNRMTFLEIDAQPITFSNSFPNLVTENSVIRPKPFAEDYETWNTVYLNGLADTTGYAWFENSPRLDFIGTGEHENITFIGFNILFHAYMAEDDAVKGILNTVMDLREDNLPDREIVPVTVDYDKNKITIRSEFDNVNTTLAYQDIFESDQPIRSMNNLLIVDRGTTVIRMTYPHLAGGLLVTLFGVLAEIATAFLIFRKSKTKSN